MFGSLLLIVAAGLVGPLLAAGRRPLLPAVVGELAAGVVLGGTGLRLIDPSAQPAPFLYGVGFVMLMLAAGSHVQMGTPAFRAGAGRGLLGLVAVAVLAVPVGLLLATLVGHGTPPALVVVLLAGSSAAVAFPIIEERRLAGDRVALLMAWIALADSVTVVLMPLTLIGPSRVPGALAGDAAIAVLAVALLALALATRRVHSDRLLLERSRQRGWALQLRVTLLALLALAAVADASGGSLLVAGFAAGLVLAQLRESERLEQQLLGLANGFFVPAFFVLLGATLDLRSLFADPQALALAVGMAAAVVVIHVVAAWLVVRPDALAAGMSASAQLGLPAAAAGLGLATGAVTPAVAAAIVGAGVLTMIPASLGTRRLAGEVSSPGPRPAASPARHG